MYYATISIFNKLPAHIKDLLNDKKQFVSGMERSLIIWPFYSISEFLNYKDEININDYSYKK